jgi:hypothetical protein
MTTPSTVRFEFGYTSIADEIPHFFAIGGIAEDVAHGIKVGLEGVDTIKDVKAAQITETRETVDIPLKSKE